MIGRPSSDKGGGLTRFGRAGAQLAVSRPEPRSATIGGATIRDSQGIPCRGDL